MPNKPVCEFCGMSYWNRGYHYENDCTGPAEGTGAIAPSATGTVPSADPEALREYRDLLREDRAEEDQWADYDAMKWFEE